MRSVFIARKRNANNLPSNLQALKDEIFTILLPQRDTTDALIKDIQRSVSTTDIQVVLNNNWMSRSSQKSHDDDDYVHPIRECINLVDTYEKATSAAHAREVEKTMRVNRPFPEKLRELRQQIGNELGIYLEKRTHQSSVALLVRSTFFGNAKLTADKVTNLEWLKNTIAQAENHILMQSAITRSIHQNKHWERFNPRGNGEYGKRLANCASFIAAFMQENELGDEHAQYSAPATNHVYKV